MVDDRQGYAKGIAWLERQFGQAVRRLREARGWSQTELAQRLGEWGFEYHQTTIGKLESGSRPLRVGELFAMAAAFGITPSTLIEAASGKETSEDDSAKIRRLLAESEETRQELLRALDRYVSTQYAVAEAMILPIVPAPKSAQSEFLIPTSARHHGEHSEAP